ncbi:MAG TPA: WD40 repeat domain-containing protein [Gemmataceae bacterium]|nr:WD40 repeat domain-containing protein [Gemmataceae bacterium]
MFRSRILFLAVAVSAALFLTSVSAQPQPAKPPALPPINPAVARLDQTIGGLDGPGFSVAVKDSGDLLAAGGEQGHIQLWGKDVSMGIRAADGTPNVLLGHDGPVTALAWNGGAVLASAGVDKKVILWEVAGEKVLHSLPAAAEVRTLAMSPDGKTLASAGDDTAVQLWDVTTGKAGAKLSGHTDWVLALAFSPDGKTLTSGGYDGTVKLWDVAAGKKSLEAPAKAAVVPNQPPPADNAVMGLAFSPDGKTLAVGGTDTLIHLLNVADAKLLRSLPGHTSAVKALAFHPSGTVLVSGGKDRTVRLWNPANGQALKALEGHTAWVEGVAFFAQGTRLVSVGADQTIRLWDLTEPKK